MVKNSQQSPADLELRAMKALRREGLHRTRDACRPLDAPVWLDLLNRRVGEITMRVFQLIGAMAPSPVRLNHGRASGAGLLMALAVVLFGTGVFAQSNSAEPGGESLAQSDSVWAWSGIFVCHLTHDADKATTYLNLKSGNPVKPASWNLSAIKEFTKAGVDLFHSPLQNNTDQYLCRDTDAVEVNDGWKLSPDEVLQKLDAARKAGKSNRNAAPVGTFLNSDRTYAFGTRDGTEGILEATPDPKNPPVKIVRYRLIEPAPVRNPNLPDGVYRIRRQGSDEDGVRVARADTDGSVVLLNRLTDGLGTTSMTSMANDNSEFRIDLKATGPFASGDDQHHFALMIDDVCTMVWGHSDPDPNGLMNLSSMVRGRAAASKFATRLKITPSLRKHPGHEFATQFSPVEKSFQPGQPVVVRMQMKNTGNVSFSFYDGGSQRGARNNQFGFSAFRHVGNGTEVPDTGNPVNFGGHVGLRTLEPGEAFRKQVDITKWFDLSKPGTYLIKGQFELNIHSGEDDRHRVDWDDAARGECLVVIADPDAAAGLDGFGTVINRELTIGEEQETTYLNLRTGKYIKPTWGPIPSAKTLRAANADIFHLGIQSNHTQKVCLDVEYFEMPNAWDLKASEISEIFVRDRLAGKTTKNSSSAVSFLNSRTVYIFETREGSRGVLQLLPKEGSNTILVARYKLIGLHSPNAYVPADGSHNVSPIDDGSGESAPDPETKNDKLFHGWKLHPDKATTKVERLPDLWEEHPSGSQSYEIHRKVEVVYSGFDGTIYYRPDKEQFYVQSDPLSASTLTYYGPYNGDPRKLIKLPSKDSSKPEAPDNLCELIITRDRGGQVSPEGISYLLDGQLISMEKLADELKVRVQKTPGLKLIIRGDPYIPYGRIAAAVSATEAAGIRIVKIATTPANKSPSIETPQSDRNAKTTLLWPPKLDRERLIGVWHHPNGSDSEHRILVLSKDNSWIEATMDGDIDALQSVTHVTRTSTPWSLQFQRPREALTSSGL